MNPPVADPAPIDSLIGRTLVERYRVLRVVGRGGMGVVYEAEHTGLRKRVAIKLMLEKYAHDAEAVARFQREALAASRIGGELGIDFLIRLSWLTDARLSPYVGLGYSCVGTSVGYQAALGVRYDLSRGPLGFTLRTDVGVRTY